jgi:hypothetical protein
MIYYKYKKEKRLQREKELWLQEQEIRDNTIENMSL